MSAEPLQQQVYQIAESLAFDQDSPTEVFDVLPRLNELVIGNMVPTMIRTIHPFARWEFRVDALSASGKSTILGQSYQKIRNHPQIVLAMESLEKGIVFISQDIGTFRRLAEERHLVKKSAGGLRPAGYQVVSQLETDGKRLASQFIEAPILFLREGVAIVGWKDYNSGKIFGAPRGDLVDIAISANIPDYLWQIVALMKDDDRDRFFKQRRKIRTAPLGVIPDLLRRFRIRDGRTPEEIKDDYARDGNEHSRVVQERDLHTAMIEWVNMRRVPALQDRWSSPEQFVYNRDERYQFMRDNYLPDWFRLLYCLDWRELSLSETYQKAVQYMNSHTAVLEVPALDDVDISSYARDLKEIELTKLLLAHQQQIKSAELSRGLESLGLIRVRRFISIP